MSVSCHASGKGINRQSTTARCSASAARVQRSRPAPTGSRIISVRSAYEPQVVIHPDDDGSGNGRGGGGRRPGGGPSGGGGGGGEGDDDTFLKLNEAVALAGSTHLPSDLYNIASTEGLRRGALEAYLALQNSFFTRWLTRTIPWFRDRLIYDNRFLFKVAVEIAIDSACATFAEVRKRGAEFWDEFEFYASDLVVGLVMDVVLVGLMAPVATYGRRRPLPQTRLDRVLAGVPSAVFARNPVGGTPYSRGGRIGCVGVKFLEYSLAGMACGFIGQGIANCAMLARRAREPDAVYAVDPPPLLKTALVWGLFMGVSSNLRYQAVFGLERVVDITVAQKVPQVAYGTTVLIRFVNNVIGGENFIDMARFFGVQ